MWDTIRMSVRTTKKDKNSHSKTNTNVVLEELDNALICSLERKTES